MAEPQNFSDPRAVDISWQGRQVSGVADGVFLTIETQADEVTAKAGAKGAIGFAGNYSALRLVKLVLLATAPDNTMFSTALRERRTSRGRAGAGVLDIRDGSGDSVATGKAIISKPPQKKYSAGVENNEWSFLMVVDESSEVIGGNTTW